MRNQLLFYFVENAGHVAKKDELLSAVWADSYVEESTLARNVSWLRKKLEEYSNGELLIETVPKRGYLFTAEVTLSDNDEDVLIVEEQTVQYFRGEETITIDEAVIGKIGEKEYQYLGRENPNSLPQHAPLPLPRAFFTLIILLVVLGVVVLVGCSLVKYTKNPEPTEQTASLNVNSKKTVKNITVDTTQTRAVSEEAQIKIGSIVNLQNRYPNDGGYLDAWGMVWSKPEFAALRTQTKFVSTHYNSNRDNGSGSWEILSANGKSNGESLVVGDRIHLKNRFPNAGYLDACGWVEHLPVFKDFPDQTGVVFTTKSPDRDNGTGVWIVRSATESDGSPVLEGDSIGIESSFSIDDKGKFRRGGFLSVAGNVKDLPAFNDYDGATLVFTQDRPSDQPILDIWTITISKAVLK